MNVCGDFLQLPPVDKDNSRKSLAKPLNESFARAVEGEDCENAAETTQEKHKRLEAKQKAVEARQGWELWREIHRVVCLDINVRAPGVLSRLQAEMRDGVISDEMWDLYMSRVVSPNDPRLVDPALNAIQFNSSCIDIVFA